MPKKIKMKYKGDMPVKDGDIVHIDESLYDTYKRILNKSDYDWSHKLTKKRSQIYIPGSWLGIKKDGEVVGVCAASFGGLKGMKVSHAAEIEGLAVIPKYRRQGFATVLVKQVLRTLMKNGYKNIYVSVWTKKKPAVLTYKKIGFRKIK